MLWLILLPVVMVSLVQLYFFLQIGWWVNHHPQSTRFMRDQLALLQEHNPKAKLKHQWVDYDRISSNLKRAIIASEDARFSDHQGVDWDALLKAYEKNAKKGKIVAGGSTITQQLAKNLFLSGGRSYVRKGQELVITYMLEYWMDKRRIFEIYLNVAEWGPGIFGAEAAARHYFGIPASRLSTTQAAYLAALLPNPRVYGRNLYSPYMMKRADLILRRMNAAALP